MEVPARRAAKRLQVSAASISDSMAPTALFQLRKKVDQRAADVVSISDQLVTAADLKPRKFRTKWQRAVYDGPAARKDAELAERERWVQLLANLLRSTDTPMGRWIRENPNNVQLLGGGRRAGSLRSRMRTIQNSLDGSLQRTRSASRIIGDNLPSTSRSGTRSLAFVGLSSLYIHQRTS